MQNESSNPSNSPLYLPALDGLRFIAFLSVFAHHLPLSTGRNFYSVLQTYGWAGVELFFVISSFLFFRLFNAEWMKEGRISYSDFLKRRLLRIYPLMVTFPAIMLVVYGAYDEFAIWRMLGVALFSDNIATWIQGYNVSIFYVPHLWSLSFEFQIYLLMPALFIVYKAAPRRKFMTILSLAFLLCTGLRIVMFGLGARHPIIWTTPFLRPESVLLGILMSTTRPTWPWQISAVIGIFSAWLFSTNPVPWVAALANVYQYPLAAVMCAAIVDTFLRSASLNRVASYPLLTYLGTISFGLYVFHPLAIHLSLTIVGPVPNGDHATYALIALLALGLTILMAAISYHTFERPFLALKKQISKVNGRDKIKAPQVCKNI